MKYITTCTLALMLPLVAQATDEEMGTNVLGSRFMEMDANDDGFVTKPELMKVHEAKIDQMFSHADTDKDGKLSKEEMHSSVKDMMKKMRNRMRKHQEKMNDQ